MKEKGGLGVIVNEDKGGGVKPGMPPKVIEVLRMLVDDGWVQVTTRGSHRQFRHPIKSGRVTVHGKPSDTLSPGTLNSIMKQSGLRKRG